MHHSACHSLNEQNVINWKGNFKDNIIKKCLGKRITKEVVILRIESYFSAFHCGMKGVNYIQIRCNFPDISYLSETQKNNFQFLRLACDRATRAGTLYHKYSSR